ncbi:MAG: tetratricopeptide repeat protein [Anaerolineae bacterium]
MPTPPTGAITFLFTDIEGSTRLWESHPTEMQLALRRHDVLIRGAIEDHHGYVFKTVGDEFCAAFESASDAFDAVVALQRALFAEPWAILSKDANAQYRLSGIRVRAGLHAGEVEERDGDYFGPVVNRSARLMAAAHGGQVVLSQAVYDLLAVGGRGDVNLRDLGLRRLRDLSVPEHIYQVIVPGLPTEFPPLRTLDVRPNNLPAQLTTLVGRERETAAIANLLARERVRLVTLIGAGGAGKTRVGLQVGADLIDVFEHGVYFVPLAPVSDPGLFFPAIAATLGLREEGTRPLRDTVADYLRDKRLLLILDNFEQLMPAAPHVADMLTACPEISALVTSRSLLRIRGEREFEIPPMRVPVLGSLPSAEHLLDYDAVRLFVERAQAVQEGFWVTPENRRAVAEICSRLDGLPLAIELAAARIKLMAPDTLLARLSSRLKTLTGGPRDLPARQQTIRNTIAWSHDLLNDEERVIFRRLSIFTGGFTLDAAEAVCAGVGELDVDTLDGITALVDNSLVRRVRRATSADEQPSIGLGNGGGQGSEIGDADLRFMMLETIREYGQVRLIDAGEVEAARRAHAAFFLQLAEDARRQIDDGRATPWLERLDVERDNLRLALDWYQERDGGRRAEDGLRMASALWRFWYFRGYWTEARSRLESLLARAQDQTVLRAWGLLAAGSFAAEQGDYVAAQTLQEEALAIYRELGDTRGLGRALHRLGSIYYAQGDYRAADAKFRSCLVLFRDQKDNGGMGLALHSLGEVATAQGCYGDADIFYREALERGQAVGNRQIVAWSLFSLGLIAYYQNDLAAARSLCEQGLQAAVELGDKHGAALARVDIGLVLAAQGNAGAGRALLEESLTVLQELGARRDVAMTLNSLGNLVEEGAANEAWTYHARAREIANTVGERAALAEALVGLARAGLAAGRLTPSDAVALMRESLALRRDLGDQRGVADSLDGFAELACVRAAVGEAESIPAAAQWLGGADALRESIGATVWPMSRQRYTRVVECVRARLGDATFAEAWGAGRSLSLPDLVQHLLDAIDTYPPDNTINA